MALESSHAWRTMRFEGELLPQWAQMLDVAAMLCGLPQESRTWFANFTRSAGADDGRSVVKHCELLRDQIRTRREQLLEALRESPGNADASLIVDAWLYTLDTMIQEARGRRTCSWRIEGSNSDVGGEQGDGDVTLRRV